MSLGALPSFPGNVLPASYQLWYLMAPAGGRASAELWSEDSIAQEAMLTGCFYSSIISSINPIFSPDESHGKRAALMALGEGPAILGLSMMGKKQQMWG